MGERYDAAFAQEFTKYATGEKKPNISMDITNTQPDPKAMHAKGYRYLGNPGGVPVWVHPSGHEIQVLSGPKREQPPSETCEQRAEKCLVDSDDEEGCRECCAEITDDERCRRQCDTGCNYKL